MPPRCCVGARAVLIRGPSGSGKSRLALSLLQPEPMRAVRPAGRRRPRRTLEAMHGRLLRAPGRQLAGLIEVRGLGIRRAAFEPVAVVGLVVDLAAADAERLPHAAARQR